MTTLHWILAIGFELFFVALVFWSKQMSEKVLWAGIGVFILACWLTLIGALFGAFYAYWLVFNLGLWLFAFALAILSILGVVGIYQHIKAEREYEVERKASEDTAWDKLQAHMRETGLKRNS